MKKKSPHVSRDDGQLGSDEEEEDGDDEEEIEKGGITECDGGNGGEEGDEMVIDVEFGSAEAAAQDFGPKLKEKDSEEEQREERSQAAEESVENDNQTHNQTESVDRDKLVTEGGDITVVNTNKDSRIETEGDNQRQSNTKECGETCSENENGHSVRQGDDRFCKVAAGEEEQNSHAEAMEVEATSTTDHCGAVRGDDDTGTGLTLLLSYTHSLTLLTHLFKL